MQRTYLVGLIAAVVIFILGGVIVFGGYNKTAEKVATSPKELVPIDLTQDIIWNGYTMQNTLFVYPAEWTLSETKTEVKKKMEVTTFQIQTTVGEEAHSISVSFGCGGDAGTDCLKGFLFKPQDQTPLTLAVLEHMKSFLETGTM
jgi:hypothetical protein